METPTILSTALLLAYERRLFGLLPQLATTPLAEIAARCRRVWLLPKLSHAKESSSDS
uniref:Uncharacterized protein n=1 Tax=Arundo donax TaxID=35708 RepID=A0A0A9HDQ4_ARUDO